MHHKNNSPYRDKVGSRSLWTSGGHYGWFGPCRAKAELYTELQTCRWNSVRFPKGKKQYYCNRQNNPTDSVRAKLWSHHSNCLHNLWGCSSHKVAWRAFNTQSGTHTAPPTTATNLPFPVGWFWPPPTHPQMSPSPQRPWGQAWCQRKVS